MYYQSSFQGFQFVQCQIVGHQEYKVSRICINKDCKEIKIVCDLCEQKHKTHRSELLSLSEVQESFQSIKKSNINETLINLRRKLDDFETQAITHLTNLVNNLKQKLNFSKLMKNSFLNKKLTSYSDLEKQTIQFLTFFELYDGGIQLKRLQASSIYPMIQDELNKFCEDLNNFWKQEDYIGPQQRGFMPEKDFLTDKFSLQQQLDKKPSAKFSLQQQLDQFSFSKDYCSQQIKLISPKCVRKIGINKSNDVVCLSNPLKLYLKQSFVFKINSLKGYIRIGILIFQQIQVNNFQFGQLNQIGHGIYMVLNNRVVYNNDNYKFNRITEKIELCEGKEYRLIFDPFNKNKQFSFQELTQENIFSMPIKIDESLAYHVFVHLGEENGEVELLNQY